MQQEHRSRRRIHPPGSLQEESRHRLRKPPELRLKPRLPAKPTMPEQRPVKRLVKKERILQVRVQKAAAQRFPHLHSRHRLQRREMRLSQRKLLTNLQTTLHRHFLREPRQSELQRRRQTVRFLRHSTSWASPLRLTHHTSTPAYSMPEPE